MMYYMVINEGTTFTVIRVSSYHRSESHVAAVDPSQAKVCQLHLALAGHQNILWFQVSVHHAIRVKECQTTQQLPHQVLNKHTHISTSTFGCSCWID